MGIMRRYVQSRQRASAGSQEAAGGIQLADSDSLGRCEAEALAAPVRSVDPYAAWLERREEELNRDRPAIRWVYRHGSDEARTAGERRPDSDAGLVVA